MTFSAGLKVYMLYSGRKRSSWCILSRFLLGMVITYILSKIKNEIRLLFVVNYLYIGMPDHGDKKQKDALGLEHGAAAYYPFRNLCMQSTDLCDICQNKSAHVVHFGRLQAIVLCSSFGCREKARDLILLYINTSVCVPVFPLYKLSKRIKLYRKSQNKVCDGYLYVDDDRFFNGGLVWNKGRHTFGMGVRYGDQHRYVSLENILHYNRDLYDDIASCESLLHDDCIRITTKDLSEKIQSYLLNIYQDAMHHKTGQFEW